MNEFDTSVAMDQTMEMPADDAQAAETISAEALAAELMNGKGAGETAADTGDGDQPAQETTPVKRAQQADNKRDNQIRAALKQQRKTIFEELGASEDTVRELIRAHRAAQITKEDPEITPKAAMKIVEAQEKAAQPKVDKSLEEMTAAVQTLIDDGWTAEELQAFVADDEAQADMANGKSVRQAARAFEKRQVAPAKTKKQSVPTFRNPATSGAKSHNLIADMSDADFAAFSDRAYQALMEGKKVTFD